ncbi:hypothetical protein EBR21_04485 [bacterium]|nr:hypothetical protein [bacterium]
MQNGRIPFQTKKRSFDLAWGAWAGILAVMTALGAALAGSQILMMHPRSAGMLVFSYPSMPRGTNGSVLKLEKDSLAFFWGANGVVLGPMSEIAAPQSAGRLVVKNTRDLKPGLLAADVEAWLRRNTKAAVGIVAVGESTRRDSRLTFEEISELAQVLEDANKKVFSVGLRPVIVPVDLVNPL